MLVLSMAVLQTRPELVARVEVLDPDCPAGGWLVVGRAPEGATGPALVVTPRKSAPTVNTGGVIPWKSTCVPSSSPTGRAGEVGEITGSAWD